MITSLPPWIACLVLMVPFVAVGAIGPDDMETERLIKQLGSQSFQEREAATRRLQEIGKPALAAVTKAQMSSDPEVRRRAQGIVLAFQEKVTKEELGRLQGVWKPVSAEYEGKPLDPKEDNWTLKFSGDKVVQMRKEKIHVEGKVEIASSTKASKRAYWKYTNVPVNNSVIYYFDKTDTLVTCWNGRDDKIAAWPNGFTTGSPESGVYLVVWKREKE